MSPVTLSESQDDHEGKTGSIGAMLLALAWFINQHGSGYKLTDDGKFLAHNGSTSVKESPPPPRVLRFSFLAALGKRTYHL
jgi:hypothetical protein